MLCAKEEANDGDQKQEDMHKELIDIWADILEELDEKVMTRKKKEAIATTRLNAYVSEELSRPEQYMEEEVCNKVDTIMKKGKAMYVTHQKKGETGRECTQDDVDLDMEAAEATWPNFKTFFGRFKNHPALGPGAVEDSSATPNVEPGPSAAAQTEHGEDTTTPETSRPSSRASIESVGDSDSASEEEEDIPMPSNKKSRKSEASLVARVGKKKGKGTAATQFLLAYAEMQVQAQLRQMQHENIMQENAMAFQAKMEQDRVKFEADLSAKLQQQNSQFQMAMMQQSQLFQAELFTKLFDKKDS